MKSLIVSAIIIATSVAGVITATAAERGTSEMHTYWIGR